ncbi:MULTISPECIES: hypothetical protein [unclassified Lysobacter]|uniref:hypothetical protein n=1 Tax=unclassified Lysobacter TaxID=2635362 RepID=UPI001BED3444|nr:MULTISPECIES: hypothetical protein [unclassified Lysobacter]MBT2747152.1 hypothetical protein [Lysobacter sp. ISL-42]MBT2752958.1 hypothetical protein [Lysobacter sp. ISL-50]MBT2778881.1 hypothetical protein [Lysobacter sp. ISL-54]MBT2784225.1 hypothetical protein [Lysobacter sp. ISL-52]
MAKVIDEFTDVSLEVGHIYYVVAYSDRDLRYPLVETVRYIERKHLDSGELVAFFENLTVTEDRVFFIVDGGLQNLLHDEETLIAELRRSFVGAEGVASFTGARKCTSN